MDSVNAAVIIPMYNRRRSVLDALRTVAAQTRRPARLIVVDDGSTDGGAEAVAGWAERSGAGLPLNLLRGPRRGAAAARNRGVAAAGDVRWFAFLDSDDLWPPDFLARTTAALAARPDAVAVTCDRQYADAEGRVARIESLAAIAADATRWLFENNPGITSASLFRADVVRRLGGFAEHLPTGHDVELYFRVSLLGPWRHAPGDPVTIRHGVDRGRGEAEHLSFSYPDRMRRVAEIYEHFVLRQGGAAALPPRLAARVLHGWWYRAGRQLMRAGRPREARRCFRRSLAWRRWSKAWLRLAQTYLPRAA